MFIQEVSKLSGVLAGSLLAILGIAHFAGTIVSYCLRLLIP